MGRPKNTNDRNVAMAFRHKESTRMLLRAIQKRKGHDDLSDTLREAVEQYIEREMNPASLAA